MDTTNSALASGAGMARDSLVPLLSGSPLLALLPAAPCLHVCKTSLGSSVLVKKWGAGGVMRLMTTFFQHILFLHAMD